MTKTIGLCFTLLLLLGLTTACSQDFIPDFNGSQTSTKSQEKSTETASNASNEGLSTPIVAPPSFGDRPPKPGQMPTQETLPNGLPALKPLKGVNVDKLFSENINDTDQRFERVENAVVDVRKELEVLKPAIVRLVAVEGDIQNLVEQLEILVKEEASRPTSASPAPVFAQAAPAQNIQNTQALSTPTPLEPQDLQPPAPPPNQQVRTETEQVAAQPPPAPPPPPPANTPVNASGPHLKTIRMADHADKVRLVFEASQKLDYSIDVDNAENLLTLTFMNANLGFDPAQIRKTSKKIKSVSATPMGNGFILAFDLGGSSAVLKQGRISPNSDNSNHRIFIDISK